MLTSIQNTQAQYLVNIFNIKGKFTVQSRKKNTAAKKQLATQYQDKVYQMKSKGTNYW
jgi:hypothetical protein